MHMYMCHLDLPCPSPPTPLSLTGAASPGVPTTFCLLLTHYLLPSTHYLLGSADLSCRNRIEGPVRTQPQTGKGRRVIASTTCG